MFRFDACGKHILAGSLALLASFGTAHARFTVLYRFSGSDGAYPFGGVIADQAGNLYGTTLSGGSGGCRAKRVGTGCGTIFELSPDGTETVLHQFTGDKDGKYPQAGLIRDSAGNLYGTTEEGGSGCGRLGCGTVFELSSDGSKTILHNFSGGSDGAYPLAPLFEDKAGNLYGTTSYWGEYLRGTVFKISPDGTESVLYAFNDAGSDGEYPYGGLIGDKAGNLYGTTSYGGKESCGTVYEVAPDGTESTLYTFLGETHGAYPHAGLIRDNVGNLYGTTSGGDFPDYGNVFKLAADGNETALYTFTGGSDGAEPWGGVIEDKAGNLYGTTEYGGTAAMGTVFKLAPDGSETVLHAFTKNRDGKFPVSTLIEGSAGYLYGTTYKGGKTACRYGCGIVFKIRELQ